MGKKGRLSARCTMDLQERLLVAAETVGRTPSDLLCILVSDGLMQFETLSMKEKSYLNAPRGEGVDKSRGENDE